ncbi:DJ-1/PfpI family protein [Kineosporia succinea]|uniref:Transcriptional regulator GlxA family with amidase domain n=1 Tax=Kineosporia succinea TaxID=84632 RepID=A0ABT9P956_9ACTN|nr:DJ-1/PfpI family protein [Kineosporia succinea]MDP9829218.1 transcriptional regulator GlxA family with amidase domain [Kineosporia succinea]
MTEPKVIGIVLFDGVEELDAVGPYEVLAYWTLNHPDDGYRTITLSPDGQVVTCAKGMRILPDHSFADAPELDVVLHPGGQGTRRLMRAADHLDQVRAWSARAELMTSVCTGSLVYAAAGLLRDRPATTHWGAIDQLREADPSVRIDEKARFVDDVTVVTSAGVSAGIDMALHLVSRLSFHDRAVAVRRGIQYDPEPPV